MKDEVDAYPADVDEEGCPRRMAGVSLKEFKGTAELRRYLRLPPAHGRGFVEGISGLC